MLTTRQLASVEHCLGTVQILEPAIDGGNNLVVPVRARDGRQFIVKHYRWPRNDGGDRLVAEFDALTLMESAGIATVPRPIYRDAAERLAIYTRVPGRLLHSHEATPARVDELAEFTLRIALLRSVERSRTIGNASEACTTLDGFERNVRNRLERLMGIQPLSALHERARAFVERVALPMFGRTVAWFNERRSDLPQVLPTEQLVLSASDVGFHNALLGADGRLWYVDFEYFGWDDPAKLLADILQHTGFELDRPTRRQLVDRVVKGLSDDAGLEQRVAVVEPLVALNWSLIGLNPFLRGGSSEPVLRQRLDAALAKLEQVTALLS